MCLYLNFKTIIIFIYFLFFTLNSNKYLSEFCLFKFNQNFSFFYCLSDLGVHFLDLSLFGSN